MVIYNQRFQIGTAALTAACISLYFYIQPILRHQNKATATIVSKTRANPSPAYPADAFPGGRDFETPYGTIKVFEWGPVDGEKVVLMHGIGTPCIALGDMAKHFVARGCRVMLFGKTSSISVEKETNNFQTSLVEGILMRPGISPTMTAYIRLSCSWC